MNEFQTHHHAMPIAWWCEEGEKIVMWCRVAVVAFKEAWYCDEREARNKARIALRCLAALDYLKCARQMKSKRTAIQLALHGSAVEREEWQYDIE